MKRTLFLSTVLGMTTVAALLVVWRGHQQPSGPGNRWSSAEPSALTKLARERERPAAPSARAPTELGAPSPGLITGICGTNAYRELQKLGKGGRLSPADCETLCRFLKEKTTDEKLERMASIKNSVMDVLARQPNLPTPWETTLSQILEDEDQHPVIRDYALQHLFSRYEEISDISRRNQLEALFWRMVGRTQESFAGTALLGLCDLSTKGFAIDSVEVARRALALVQNPAAASLGRISAIQVCALLGERQALPEALRTAASGETIALRASAIAVIGALGAEADLPVLQRFTEEPNPSIRRASRLAAQRIKTKTNG
jgi:hypothetical protein